MKRAVVLLALLWGMGVARASEFPFVAACEEALKEGLIAPSTFHLVKLTQRMDRITFDELLAEFDSENVKKLMRATATRDPIRMVALIEYEAMNAHGVPLRLKSKCTYETARDSDVDLEEAKGLVKIDGRYISRAEEPDQFTLKRHRPN